MTEKDPQPRRGSSGAKNPARAHAFAQLRAQSQRTPCSPVPGFYAKQEKTKTTHTRSSNTAHLRITPSPDPQAARGPPDREHSANRAKSVPTSLLPVRKYLQATRHAVSRPSLSVSGD